jgi:hypothetical protein
MDLGVVLMEVHRDLVRTQHIGGAWAVVCSDMRDMAIIEQKGQEARVRSNYLTLPLLVTRPSYLRSLTDFQ